MKFVAILGILFISQQALGASLAGKQVDNRRDNPEERGPYFEGDIILDETQGGLRNETYRWPQATVIYDVDPKFTIDEIVQIQAGIQEIVKKTCIRFKKRVAETEYVYVQRGAAESGTGCYSSVGRVGGKQTLNLEVPNCLRLGTVSHEFIHALGFYHEQSRTDRDEYVTIVWANIRPGLEHNFNKYEADVTDPFNVTYDYGSVMHYSAYGFAINPVIPTIIPNVPNVEIGQRLGLSASDALKLNNMYNCSLSN
ncbi:unnamed protein product [Allacma fusca]|uniref:Peptidase M12A domain-containing protein n=1 Tax=Allacma fusca TaxID=39272 RepID=A0A8J2JFS3_9HEXA|nr:unnamed protein product [Allacma fusca]